MKQTVMQPVEVEIDSVRVTLPMRYGDEDVPYDFPLRNGDTWRAVIDVDTGKIRDWPTQPCETRLTTKVTDSGVYELFEGHRPVAAINGDYVPHGLIPGKYGDYVDFRISPDGVILNWPKKPDVSAFFNED